MRRSRRGTQDAEVAAALSHELTKRLETEKQELAEQVEYWKREAGELTKWKGDYETERKRRMELKVVFDDTYKELQQSQKLIMHLKADRLMVERARQAIQSKCRILSQEVETWKKQRDVEQALRTKAEARADEFEIRYNEERAQRLQNLHKMNKEQTKVYMSEQKEKEATNQSIETSKAAKQLSGIIKQLESTVDSDQRLLETQYRELQAQASEVETLKTESMMLRKIVAEKNSQLVAQNFRFVELEKELWRIQREAGQMASRLEKSTSERNKLITRPSALGSDLRGWTPSALCSVLAQHKREGMLFEKAMVTETTGTAPLTSSGKRPRSSWLPVKVATPACDMGFRSGPPMRACAGGGVRMRTREGGRSLESSTQPLTEEACSNQVQHEARESTLRVNGSLFVGNGLGVRKELDSYFDAEFSGSPKQMAERVVSGYRPGAEIITSP